MYKKSRWWLTAFILYHKMAYTCFSCFYIHILRLSFHLQSQKWVLVGFRCYNLPTHSHFPSRLVNIEIIIYFFFKWLISHACIWWNPLTGENKPSKSIRHFQETESDYRNLSFFLIVKTCLSQSENVDKSTCGGQGQVWIGEGGGEGAEANLRFRADYLNGWVKPTRRHLTHLFVTRSTAKNTGKPKYTLHYIWAIKTIQVMCCLYIWRGK